MQTVKQLLKADNDIKKGNHRVVNVGNGKRHFIYFQTAICKVDDNNKTFIIDDSWGSQSTTRACNSYRNELLKKGYTEIK